MAPTVNLFKGTAVPSIVKGTFKSKKIGSTSRYIPKWFRIPRKVLAVSKFRVENKLLKKVPIENIQEHLNLKGTVDDTLYLFFLEAKLSKADISKLNSVITRIFHYTEEVGLRYEIKKPSKYKSFLYNSNFYLNTFFYPHNLVYRIFPSQQYISKEDTVPGAALISSGKLLCIKVGEYIPEHGLYGDEVSLTPLFDSLQETLGVVLINKRVKLGFENKVVNMMNNEVVEKEKGELPFDLSMLEGGFVFGNKIDLLPQEENGVMYLRFKVQKFLLNINYCDFNK